MNAVETVSFRQLQAGDEDRMARLFFRLTPETIYRRFMTHYSDPQPLRPLLEVDGTRRVAVVAVDSSGEIIGVARYSRLADAPDTAEIAVLVEDAWQGRRIGLQLLDWLAGLARRRGIRHFTGTMLADNRACAALMRRAFPDVVLQSNGTETSLYVDLAAGDAITTDRVERVS